MYIVNNMLCVYLEYFNIIKNKIKLKNYCVNFIG